MRYDNPMMDPMCSVYPQAPGLKGEDRYFGLFPNQRIMGYRCSIKTVKLPDGDPGAIDLLGLAGMFRVGELVVHISGRTNFGAQCWGSAIIALGTYQMIFDTPDGKKPVEKNSSFGGMGVDGPDVCCISGDTEHHAMFSECDYFVTLRGLKLWAENRKWAPIEVCRYVDDVRNKTRTERQMKSDFAVGRQHTSAIRRLAETAISIKATIDGYHLEQVRRGCFVWREIPSGVR
jgi:hypothetical protein